MVPDDDTAAPPAVRAVVADSWMRSSAAGVDAEAGQAPVTMDQRYLRDYREAHVLGTVFPLLDDVVGQAARDSDAVMAVSDADGHLLWVCGTSQVLRRAEQIGFVEGSNWDERLAGTNAPGTALALDRPVQVLGREHFRTSVGRWNCAAAPIHDPGDGELLGVIDVTGFAEVAGPQTVALVRAAARMAEAELARDQLTRSAAGHSGARAARPGTAGAGVVVSALGQPTATVHLDDRHHAPRQVRLSPRHSEIVVLLASAPHGLSGDELGMLLYEEDMSSATLRAELNRLRSLLGDDLLASRPYRLVAEVTSDWLAVEAQVAGGSARSALKAYRGPLLSGSTAPGVVRLREQVESTLRRAIIRGGEADLMSQWTRSWWGSDDFAMWRAQLQATPPTSPMYSVALAQAARLDAELRAAAEPRVRRPAR